MLTLLRHGNRYNKNIMHFCGTSSDEKPIGQYRLLSIPNGSEFFEMDTKTTYLYDEDNDVWIKKV